MKFLLKNFTCDLVKNTKGFTLVELLVSTAIFILVVTLSTGALFSAQALNVRLQQTQTVLDSVNLAVEIMVRDIRYGTNFYCDTVVQNVQGKKDCTYSAGVGGSVLILTPPVGLSGTTDAFLDRIAYFVSNGALYKNEYPYGASPRLNIQITPTDVTLNPITFYVRGSNNPVSSDYNQPVITLLVSGVTIPVKSTIDPVSFNVQTSISSRTIDN